MAMEVTEILLNAQSADGSVRKHAEESLKQFQEQNLPGFLSSLSAELANEEKTIDIRKLSGLILKDALDAKEKHRKFERWLSLDVSIKTQIKSFLLQTLSSRVHEARSTASQVIAKVAGIELPKKQWPELITSLLSNINPHVKQATLETVGYIFEEVTYLVEQDQANKNLAALVEVLNASKASNDAKLGATRALYKARAGTAARQNFFSSLEEGYIMIVVCEEILSPKVKLTPLVNVALDFMPTALVRDPHNLVKVTTAWTLGRIFWFLLLNRSTMESPIITPDDALLILLSLEDAPNVAEKAYGALYLVVTWWRVSILLTAIHRKISSESTLRTAAYETLKEVVSCSNAPMVLQLVPVITMELHKTLEDHNLLEVPILCGFLQMIIQKIGSSDATKHTDQIMSLLVRYAPQIVTTRNVTFSDGFSEGLNPSLNITQLRGIREGLERKTQKI